LLKERTALIGEEVFDRKEKYSLELIQIRKDLEDLESNLQDLL
jgi:hypothetical protein